MIPAMPKKKPAGVGGPQPMPMKPAKILPVKQRKRAAKVPKAMHQQIAEKMLGGGY